MPCSPVLVWETVGWFSNESGRIVSWNSWVECCGRERSLHVSWKNQTRSSQCFINDRSHVSWRGFTTWTTYNMQPARHYKLWFKQKTQVKHVSSPPPQPGQRQTRMTSSTQTGQTNTHAGWDSHTHTHTHTHAHARTHTHFTLIRAVFYLHLNIYSFIFSSNFQLEEKHILINSSDVWNTTDVTQVLLDSFFWDLSCWVWAVSLCYSRSATSHHSA